MSKATFQNTFSKFTSFLNFNKGMSLASVSYGVLLTSLQVTLDANEQVGSCTSYAEFLFWIGFSVLCFGAAADLFYDSARMVRQWIGMTTRTMDPLWGEDASPYRPDPDHACVRLFTIVPDERVPAKAKPFNYFCYFTQCPSLCHTSVPSTEAHDVDFECCGFNGIEVAQKLDYEDKNQATTLSSGDSVSRTVKIKNARCKCGKFVLLVLTLFIRFVSNLALALAIPTATMYNYLHEKETKGPATPTPPPPPPPAGVPAPTEEFDCFISSNSLEDLLIASSVVALVLIVVRSTFPTWSKVEFKYEFGG